MDDQSLSQMIGMVEALPAPASHYRLQLQQAGLTTVGGEGEVWYYRQSWRGVWEKTGALDWLRQVKPGNT